MPELVGPKDWSVDMDQVKRWLERRADKVLVREMHEPEIYLFNGAEVEVVDPVYNPEFCMNCHRIRVTHKGELKGCLNRNDDLIPTRGLDDTALRGAFRQVVAHRVSVLRSLHSGVPDPKPGGCSAASDAALRARARPIEDPPGRGERPDAPGGIRTRVTASKARNPSPE